MIKAVLYKLALLCLILTLSPSPVLALGGIKGSWFSGGASEGASSTNSGPSPSVMAIQGEDAAVCAQAISHHTRGKEIDADIAMAVGLTEAGRFLDSGVLAIWPWTANAAGEGRFFETKKDAIAWVREKQGQGVTSIDVGCMQINLKWHPEAFASLEEAFEPSINVAYGVDYLATWVAQHGIEQGVGRYHSSTTEHQERYLASFRRNQKQSDRLLEVANNGVPTSLPTVSEEVSLPGFNLFTNMTRSPIIQ